MYILESNDGAVILSDGKRRLRIAFITEAIVRLTFTEGKPFTNKPSLVVTTKAVCRDYHLQENTADFTIATSALRLVVSKQTAPSVISTARAARWSASRTAGENGLRPRIFIGTSTGRARLRPPGRARTAFALRLLTMYTCSTEVHSRRSLSLSFQKTRLYSVSALMKRVLATCAASRGNSTSTT